MKPTDLCYDLVPRGYLEARLEWLATWSLTALIIIGPVVAAESLRILIR